MKSDIPGSYVFIPYPDIVTVGKSQIVLTYKVLVFSPKVRAPSSLAARTGLLPSRSLDDYAWGYRKRDARQPKERETVPQPVIK